MYCRKCGKKLNDDALFCPYCGTKIEKNIEAQSESALNRDNNTSTAETLGNIPDEDIQRVALPNVEKALIKSHKGVITFIIGLVCIVAVICIFAIPRDKEVEYDVVELNKFNYYKYLDVSLENKMGSSTSLGCVADFTIKSKIAGCIYEQVIIVPSRCFDDNSVFVLPADGNFTRKQQKYFPYVDEYISSIRGTVKVPKK